MLVRTLVSWSGTEFNYVPGNEIDLPDATASARVEAGLAVAVKVPAKPKEVAPAAPVAPVATPAPATPVSPVAAA